MVKVRPIKSPTKDERPLGTQSWRLRCPRNRGENATLATRKCKTKRLREGKLRSQAREAPNYTCPRQLSGPRRSGLLSPCQTSEMTRPGAVMSLRRREFVATSVAGRYGKRLNYVHVLRLRPVTKAPSESGWDQNGGIYQRTKHLTMVLVDEDAPQNCTVKRLTGGTEPGEPTAGFML